MSVSIYGNQCNKHILSHFHNESIRSSHCGLHLRLSHNHQVIIWLVVYCQEIFNLIKLNLSIGQLPNLFGITGVETRLNPPYRILIDFCAGLPRTKSDVAIGLISLAFLYAVKYGCAYGEKRSTKYKKVFFFCSILRYIICIIVTTFISWLILRNITDEKLFPFRVVKKVPRGLNHVKVPNFEPQLVNAVFKSIHIIVLISLLEHISIAKSFGRINDYKGKTFSLLFDMNFDSRLLY